MYVVLLKALFFNIRIFFIHSAVAHAPPDRCNYIHQRFLQADRNVGEKGFAVKIFQRYEFLHKARFAVFHFAIRCESNEVFNKIFKVERGRNGVNVRDGFVVIIVVIMRFHFWQRDSFACCGCVQLSFRIIRECSRNYFKTFVLQHMQVIWHEQPFAPNCRADRNAFSVGIARRFDEFKQIARERIFKNLSLFWHYRFLLQSMVAKYF